MFEKCSVSCIGKPPTAHVEISLGTLRGIGVSIVGFAGKELGSVQWDLLEWPHHTEICGFPRGRMKGWGMRNLCCLGGCLVTQGRKP